MWQARWRARPFSNMRAKLRIIPLYSPNHCVKNAEHVCSSIIFCTFAVIMMNWNQLISNRRLGQEHRHPERHDDRTEFKRDYDRLIFSAPFRRLQNKTQVFPLPGSVFVHNRLTHSLEVASVGMSLGNDVARLLCEKTPAYADTLVPEIGQIVATACLAHDMGNPPFGHSGEKAIQSFFTEGKGAYLQEKVSAAFWSDITHFEGNANAFRLLTHHFDGRRRGGFVMTYSTLASIVKYPFTSNLAGEHQKFGFFTSEREAYQRIATRLGIPQLDAPMGALRYARFPLVYLVEAADDICYEIMDIEDAHKLKLLSTADTRELLLAYFPPERQCQILEHISQCGVDDDGEQIVYLRSSVINLLENECVQVFVDNEADILAGRFTGSLIEHISPTPRRAYEACVEASYRHIYHCREVVDIELAGFRVMTELMHLMVEAAMNPQRAYSQLILGRVSKQYQIRSQRIYDRLLAVLDYISGMTDVYALDLYRKTTGISLRMES